MVPTRLHVVACLLACAVLRATATNNPVAIINNTPCTATGTIGYTGSGCKSKGDQFEFGPKSSGKVFSSTNSGCLVAAVLSGLTCDGQRSVKCGQFASNGVPSDQWVFQINGDSAECTVYDAANCGTDGNYCCVDFTNKCTCKVGLSPVGKGGQKCGKP